MRKYLSIVLAAIILISSSGLVMAEMSAQSYTGKRYEEQQVLVAAYNNSGASVSANSVVIWDTTATAGTTLGSYFTTSTTADSVYVAGVLRDTTADGIVGQIIVRGPARPYIESNAAIAAGDQLSVGNDQAGTTQEYATSDGTAGGVLGTALAAESGERVWIWVNPYVHK